MPGRIIAMTGLIAGLAAAQGVIRSIAAAFDDTADASTTTGKLIFGLHGINGLIIMMLAGNVVRRSRVLSRSAATGRPADARVFEPASGPAHRAP